MSSPQDLLQHVPVIVLGVGNVGAAVVTQLLAARRSHAQRHGIHFSFVALSDSSAAVDTRELDDAAIAQLVAFKSNARFSHLDSSAHTVLRDTSPVELVQALWQPRTIVLDCSATHATTSALVYAIEHGGGAALANKKPVSGAQDAFDVLTAPGSLARVGLESTVGAGTPMVAALLRMLASGDDVRKIEGTFSGTLGFLVSGLQAGRAYSEVVQEAFKLGYTEPEPRDDLGGMDVARKALILARLLGWKLDMEDVSVEPLFPAEMKDLSVPEFLAALPGIDEEYRKRDEAAKAEGKVLRYTACVEDGKCVVSLKSLDADSPIGRLQGTLNMVEFHSAIYDPPLVVQGIGAGAAVTAAGVIADAVNIAEVLIRG